MTALKLEVCVDCEAQRLRLGASITSCLFFDRWTRLTPDNRALPCSSRNHRHRYRDLRNVHLAVFTRALREGIMRAYIPG